MTRALYATLLATLAPTSQASSVIPVPELDGTGALAAVALLAGVVALAAERRGRRK